MLDVDGLVDGLDSGTEALRSWRSWRSCADVTQRHDWGRTNQDPLVGCTRARTLSARAQCALHTRSEAGTSALPAGGAMTAQTKAAPQREAGTRSRRHKRTTRRWRRDSTDKSRSEDGTRSRHKRTNRSRRLNGT